MKNNISTMAFKTVLLATTLSFNIYSHSSSDIESMKTDFAMSETFIISVNDSIKANTIIDDSDKSYVSQSIFENPYNTEFISYSYKDKGITIPTKENVHMKVELGFLNSQTSDQAVVVCSDDVEIVEYLSFWGAVDCNSTDHFFYKIELNNENEILEYSLFVNSVVGEGRWSENPILVGTASSAGKIRDIVNFIYLARSGQSSSLDFFGVTSSELPGLVKNITKSGHIYIDDFFKVRNGYRFIIRTKYTKNMVSSYIQKLYEVEDTSSNTNNISFNLHGSNTIHTITYPSSCNCGWLYDLISRDELTELTNISIDNDIISAEISTYKSVSMIEEAFGLTNDNGVLVMGKTSYIVWYQWFIDVWVALRDVLSGIINYFN